MIALAAMMLAVAPGEPYGTIGRIVAKPGRRDALAAVIGNGCQGMPGCRAYVLAKDAKDADTLWITEAWVSRAAHTASLSLPRVRAAIAKGRPLIAAMDSVAETIPVTPTD